MSISDWGSDGCPSGLEQLRMPAQRGHRLGGLLEQLVGDGAQVGERRIAFLRAESVAQLLLQLVRSQPQGHQVVEELLVQEIPEPRRRTEIGRASCRERVCQYV